MGLFAKIFSNRIARRALLAFSAFAAFDAGAAVRCQLHLGLGCNGPVVYGMQLCARVTFNQGKCERLCGGVQPICKVSDFDAWVSAYEDKGRNGIHGELAESNVSDQFDQSGQLLKTSGNAYTVCMSTAGLIGSYSSEYPIRSTGTQGCGNAVVASDSNCSAGTVFNGDPTHPQCITKDSYCGGGGSTGSYVTTMSAGFQLVDIQNSHFLAVGEQDNNLQTGAATAGTDLPGLSSATGASTGVKFDGLAGTGNSSGKRQASAATSGSGAGIAPPAGSDTGSAKSAATAGDDSAFASKTFGMESSGYGGAGGGHGAGDPSGSGAGGVSWFGAGGAAGAATAGGANGDVGFDGSASRGLASAGTLDVNDPENYFLLSDVSVSLFKRVTTVCRKKERSLVLAP
ncbi:MAG: hypothetical protein JST04_02560 [Bdellovibrionales bacterium]|nr:hypothetical protein [Bdellovibrionales bacterium]